MTLTAKITINPYMVDDNLDELSRLIDTLNLNRGITFSYGENANQVNMVFHDIVPLANTANHTKSFDDGSLSNKVGIPITLEKLKVIYVKNLSTDADLTVGDSGGSAIPIFGAVAHTIVIPPGGEWLFIAPDVNGVDCDPEGDVKFALGAGSSAPGYELIVMGVDPAP